MTSQSTRTPTTSASVSESRVGDAHGELPQEEHSSHHHSHPSLKERLHHIGEKVGGQGETEEEEEGQEAELLRWLMD